MADILSFWKITSLALADSVNPCEIAVLAMVLIAILIQNPEKRRRVLFGGFAFISAVYVGYLVYGLIIIQFFNIFAEFLRQKSVIIYRVLAIIAMVLGALNIKDFFVYKKGSFATEMPLFLRPRVKRIIDRITSPGGAFIIGFLVTLFLLPCTMGPYIVASGLLASLGTIGAVPWLLYYNLVFVLPMIIIVFLIYFGFAEVDEVTGWKERNVRYLHLIAGALLFLVGLAMLLGWI